MKLIMFLLETIRPIKKFKPNQEEVLKQAWFSLQFLKDDLSINPKK